MCATQPPIDVKLFKDKIRGLLQEVEQRFQILGELEKQFEVFCSPFTVNASDLPVHIQLEIIDLHYDSDLKLKFSSAVLGTIYWYILPDYPSLTALAAKMLCIFGSTYLCEKVFFCNEHNKTKLRSRLTQNHLSKILKLAAIQDGTPGIDALLKAKRCQVSGSK